MHARTIYASVMLATGALVAMAATAPGHDGARRAARRLTIVASNYAFQVPDTIGAGWNEIHLQNKGPELHHAYLFRLDAGKTMGDLMDAMAKGGAEPAWAHDAGGPNAPVPGGESVALVDFKPGTYALICVIPGPDGQPHVMKGMAKQLTVVPAAKAAKAEVSMVDAPDVTLTLVDYGFSFDKPLTAGRHVIRIGNGAAQPHEVLLVQLAPGKRAEDVAAWVEKMDGPPPGAPIGGITPMAQGDRNDVIVTLQKGNYALLCFMPDAKDGKPHVMHGMLQTIAVE